MGALALLTFVVLALIPVRRFRAGFAGQVNKDDFSLGESARVPDRVRLSNRNYMNLLELPVLFYTVCLMFFVSHRVSEAVMLTAWVYVGLRALHSLIHTTYNNVNHRLTVFAFSNFVLIILWGMFFFMPSAQIVR